MVVVGGVTLGVKLMHLVVVLSVFVVCCLLHSFVVQVAINFI